jgi:hypothetical protein
MRTSRQYVFALIAICAPLSLVTRPAVAQQSGPNSSCCAIVAQAIDAIGRIKKDTARADIEKDFVADGGIFSRDETIYTYRLCPYVKIKVYFSLDPSSNDFARGSPRDVARSLSKPYLEYPARD